MNLIARKFNDAVLDERLVEDLSEKLKLNKKLVELLILRGYDNADAIRVFLYPDKDNFYDPMLMLGMKECCERLEQAIENNEKVVVYGDYDADGICAAAILSLYLSSRGLDVYAHIPDRLNEGYGLNVESIEHIIDRSMPDLILTCDCGISAVDVVEYTKDLGVDIVVTDHHEVGELRPDCIIVNPHQPECKYPFKDLCGAGVALKIVQALGGVDAAFEYLDLAAIATVADIVSLTDENRLIVQLGLSIMTKTKNLGILALLDSLKLNSVTSNDITFKIAPRINAAGRMGSAYRAFELFTSRDPDVVQDRLNQIIDANNERKMLGDELYSKAIELLRNEDLATHRAIILIGDDWQRGITGVLASKLVGDFKRPVFILVKNNDEYRGSCRSIEGINIFELLQSNADILEGFGGHNQAAGFTILPQNVPEFKKRIYAQLEKLDVSMFLPQITYDMELSEAEVTKDFARALDLVEPTGNSGNPKPVFMTRTTYLSATPQKKNTSNTILSTKSNLQFFAQYAYSLNTYYNGPADRQMFYELSENDYGRRLYLVGCATERLNVVDALAKGGFLRMLNYPSVENCKYTEYDREQLNDIIDYPFGILVIAGCKATYDKYAGLLNDNIIMHEIFSETSSNVYTRLMVSPELSKTFMLENYNKVIFLDYPPSLNAVSYINRRSDAAVYIPRVDNRHEVFSCVKSDRGIFGKYYNAIKANSGIKAPNIYAYYKQIHAHDKALELPQFIACLSVFTQLKLMSFVAGGGVIIKPNVSDLASSDIYKTIEAWQ